MQACTTTLLVVLPVVIVCECFHCSITIRLAAKLNQGMLLMADGYISTWNRLGCGPRPAVRLTNAHHLHFTNHTELVCQAVCATIHKVTTASKIAHHLTETIPT